MGVLGLMRETLMELLEYMGVLGLMREPTKERGRTKRRKGRIGEKKRTRRQGVMLQCEEELCECRMLALLEIPKLLSQLEDNQTYEGRYKLFGYVTAFLASLYGHRHGVFSNMSDGQVTKAVHCPEYGDYLVKVEEHKTNRTFGFAKMLLSEGYGWLLSIIEMKRTLPAGTGSSPYLFFSNTTSPTSQLTRNLQLPWADMKLRGGATFTSLRTAVATFARDRHGEDSEERHCMARLMCHDTATADKYYAMDLTIQQAQDTTSNRTLSQCDAVDLGGAEKKKKEKKEREEEQEESTPPQSHQSLHHEDGDENGPGRKHATSISLGP